MEGASIKSKKFELFTFPEFRRYITVIAKKLPVILCVSIFSSVLFFSCAALPTARMAPTQAPAAAQTTPAPEAVDKYPPPELIAQALPRENGFFRDKVQSSPPERPKIPPIPEHILGEGQIPQDKLVLFLKNVNSQVRGDFVESLSAYYREEAAAEGVNHDIAFAQMCLETGFLRYGGLVTADMNNFCGLGSIGPGQNGEYFPEPQIGVRAHIQHLKAYATDAPLKGELVDPRYRWVRYGSAPTISGLAGAWAADRSYAEKITDILERLYRFAYGETGTQVVQADTN
ncbi:hypothetical protein AGMMS49579_15940 [Spirochaetia bacterium]|nr:hypothetical protein AGMMS49579_15940 [Spirochaetia bacterium]